MTFRYFQIMSFDQKSLELFIRAATLGAIGRAGREFGLSATASTQRIQGLEKELGARLLNRTTRRVALTPDGELFLDHARQLVDGMEDARALLSGAGTHVRGELRVTASASFGRRHVAPYMAEFFEMHPDVSMHLDLSDSIADMVEQGFDLALRIGTLASSSLVARKLVDNPRLLVAAPAYLSRHGLPSGPDDLARYNHIVLGETRSWHLRDAAGRLHTVRTGGNFSTTYGEAITEAALGGLGIALKSKWDVQVQLDEGNLVPVLEDCAVEPLWSVWAVRPPGRMVPARVRAFTDFIEGKLKQLPA